MAPLMNDDDTRNQTLIGSHIPTVTADDLSRFYQKHFSNRPSPTQFFIQPEPELEYEEYEEEDDGFGYYPDGVKRTLTDEQIAMFRHSEIQALIKEREAQTSTDDQTESKGSRSDVGPIFARRNFQHYNNDQQKREKRRPRQAKSKRKAAEAAMEEAKRRRRNSSSDLEEPRLEVEEERHDPEDFLSDGDEKTYRRKAREADVIKETTVELDY